MKNALFFALSVIVFSSCATYKRCQQKFASTVPDSVKVEVPVSVTVPKDSVVYSFVTDTATFHKQVKQGRANVLISRTPKITIVKATCDSVFIYQKVPVNVPGPRVVWGVAPKYRTWFLIAASMLGLSLLGNLIQYHLGRTKSLKHELYKATNQLH